MKRRWVDPKDINFVEVIHVRCFECDNRIGGRSVEELLQKLWDVGWKVSVETGHLYCATCVAKINNIRRRRNRKQRKS